METLENSELNQQVLYSMQRTSHALKAMGLDKSKCPETIHFTRGLQEAAGQDFDLLFASHNLEHQPDLIGHLKQAAAALRPGGAYMLILPDRRFCFDHFLPDLTLPRLLDAHLQGRTMHTAQSVIEHRAFTCHNDTLRHWHGDHGPEPDGMDGRIDYALNELKAANGGYVDVHAWQFTPQSFESVMTTLNRLGWSPFRPLRVYDTAYGRNEFTAVLTLDAAA
jgi:SAM-dependent methyltransferase